MRSTPWPKLILRTVKLACGPAAARNHDAFECLQTLLVAFLDLHVHADGVARHELRNVGALGLRQKFFNDQVSHDFSPSNRSLDRSVFLARDVGQQLLVFVAQRGPVQQIGPVAPCFFQGRASPPAAYFFMIAETSTSGTCNPRNSAGRV